MKKSTIVLLLATFSELGVSSDLSNIDLAKADLANRQQVPLEQVTVVAINEKTWNDSSMGCPQPGRAYLQVLIDGSQLLLAVAEKRYYYHAGGSRRYFYCARPKNSNREGNVSH